MADDLKLEPPIRAVLDATNAADNKAFVAAFSKDGAVNDWGEVHQGRGEISKWDREHNTGAGIKVRPTGVSRLGGEILVLVEITRGEEKEGGTWSFRLKGASVAALEIG
ncbi:MAG: hypothetical protein AAGC46_09570 [Solirubrobacteraceae bacterium]